MEEAIKFHDGAQTITAVIGESKVTVNMLSNGPDAVKITSLLNSVKSSILKEKETVEDVSSELDKE